MLTLGRLGWNVRTLNFSNITVQERSNAEMYYLSRIAKELGEALEENGEEVKRRHPRWAELCRCMYLPPEICSFSLG